MEVAPAIFCILEPATHDFPERRSRYEVPRLAYRLHKAEFARSLRCATMRVPSLFTVKSDGTRSPPRKAKPLPLRSGPPLVVELIIVLGVAGRRPPEHGEMLRLDGRGVPEGWALRGWLFSWRGRVAGRRPPELTAILLVAEESESMKGKRPKPERPLAAGSAWDAMGGWGGEHP